MDLDLVLRTSGLLFVALTLTRVLGRATAATRHLIWHTAVVAVLFAPVAVLVAPRFEIEMPNWLGVQSVSSDALPTIQPEVAAARATPVATTGVAALARVTRAGTWILLSWFLFGWMVSGWQAARSSDAPPEWVNDASRLAARLRFRQTPTVRQTQSPGTPRVGGLFRPVILLPLAADQWNASDREAALLHELSHIRRADRRTQALAQVACAIYWFNPLVWIAAAALAREREGACDDEVLKAGIRPSAYASLLLDLAKGRHTWAPAAALGMARPSTIEGRLLAILATDEPDVPPKSRRRLTSLRSTRWLVIAGSIVVVATMLGAQQPQTETRKDSAIEPLQMSGPRLMNLGDQEPPASLTKALTRALDDPDRQVRERAAFGLALVPGTAIIDPLLTALQDSDAQVREKAAIGLAFRRDPRVIDPLLKAMGDSDAQVREKVAIALGASGDPRATAALEDALGDPDAQVREKAASGLVLLGLRK
jgi:beta-lactamase regulating signal transducer with metallopeptidase domain